MTDITDEQIEWRPIPGWEGLYEASVRGEIRSVPRLIARAHPRKPGIQQVRRYGGKVLSPARQTKGYRSVELWRDNKGGTYSVHRLVCAAFHGEAADEMEVNHINGVKSDNRPANLEWVTRRGNLEHAEKVLGRKMVWTLQSERAKARREAA